MEVLVRGLLRAIVGAPQDVKTYERLISKELSCGIFTCQVGSERLAMDNVLEMRDLLDLNLLDTHLSFKKQSCPHKRRAPTSHWT